MPGKETNPAAPMRRTLVGEILLTQLGYALVVGAVAIAALWSGASWVIRDNMSDWTARWIDDLDSLGVGLYHESADAGYVAIEGYVAKFPEIAFVRYYDPAGQLVYVEPEAQPSPNIPLLQTPQLDALLRGADSEDSYALNEHADTAIVSISRAVSTATIDSDGFFEAATLEDVEVQRTVVGFVELGLDYSHYDGQLIRNILRVSLVVAGAFLVLALVGRILLRRALQPLTDIAQPLARLAEGDADIHVDSSAHREIALITDGLATAAARIHERDAHLTFLANHDDLTGLPNRHSFMSMLEEMMASEAGPRGAVLFIDLDQFKYVNDTLGHLAGDAVLKQAAARITRSVGEFGRVARFGGDEFGVVVSRCSAERALDGAEKVIADLTEYPFMQGGQPFNLTCSIGVAVAEDSKSLTASDLVAFADLACQQAKSDGRNRVRIYRPEAGAIDAIKQDIGWSRKIQRALKMDTFVLHYQPIAAIATGDVSHFEVLLRMRDEDGLHNPAAFLSAAERFGLMNEIDRWVIEHGLRNLTWFRRQDPSIRFTINLSGGAFIDGDLVDFVTGQLALHSLDASAVIFEITEQVAVGSFVDAAAQIAQLIDCGCEFALDDFGTGYSTFTYLKKLPMQYVKIDGSFIQHLDESEVDQVMVRAIAEAAKALGKKTIAEFVGSEKTLKLLKKLGIDYAQGHFIGKPGAKIGRYAAPQVERTIEDRARS